MSAKIHATAIIDKNAELDSSVEVGPFSIIGPNVKIDAGTRIAGHVTISDHTIIGKHNQIFQYSSLGEAPQDKKYKNEPTLLEIGDNNTIREFCTFNRGTVQDKGTTKIGNDNWIMAYVHLAHDCVIGNHTIFANNASLAEMCIRDRSKTNHHAIKLQFKTLLLAISSLYASSALALEPFVVKDIRVEGLQRTEAGTVFTYLPVKVGETMNDELASQAIKSLYGTGFFKDVRIEAEEDVLVVTVQERSSIAQIDFSGNKSFPTDKMKEGLKQIGIAEGLIFDKSQLDRAEQEIKRQYLSQGKYLSLIHI